MAKDFIVQVAFKLWHKMGYQFLILGLFFLIGVEFI
jgi:hypothetical protein